MRMQFFFPDSQDQIDPSFDFTTEERSLYRVRQRDDQYAHEALRTPPFDGFLVSKTIVDGLPGAAGKYTIAQRNRLYRVGIREFFRLDGPKLPCLSTLGDCGAFSYVRETRPPYEVDAVIDFYDHCGFDLGISVDHVILGFDLAADRDNSHPQRVEWEERQRLTLDLAAEFRRRARSRKVGFVPVGAAQGWSPASYAASVKALQKMGYRRIALGGMVPLKTPELLDCLQHIDTVRRGDTQLHLLGVTRCDHIERFAELGVTSFDSTSPFRQSFKDDADNFYALDRSYTALRVPQVDGNPRLRGRIRAGQVQQEKAIELEQRCLTALRRYDAGRLRLRSALDALCTYDDFSGSNRPNRRESYAETLEARPWRTCTCGLCAKAGIDIAIFRGAERNKRRGFHNLYVFRERLRRSLGVHAA